MGFPYFFVVSKKTRSHATPFYGFRDEGKYFSAVEDSGWLQQIGKLLEISSAVAASIENEKCSVVVAFGFGTDRTAQV